ncbi:hypothetical protein BT93_G1005 [Corymbia citriodora subsp. variegata]|nr:hypothetical protein BT93_G1005 [Corymbia citriodora subsp. variegata]
MEDLSFKRLAAMAAMLALILSVSMVRVRGDDTRCFQECAVKCECSRDPACYPNCVIQRQCTPPPSSNSVGHCELGCTITKCIGLKSSDCAVLGACANACSKDCKATFIEH